MASAHAIFQAHVDGVFGPLQDGMQLVWSFAATGTPAQSQLIDLASGDNTITRPSSGGMVPLLCCIIPPAGSSIALKLKGDTQIAGNQPTILTAPASFVLNAGAPGIPGCRLVWL